MITRDVLWIDS